MSQILSSLTLKYWHILKGACFKHFFIAIFTSAIFFLVCNSLAPVRVGDGAEYYGLFLAFKSGMMPWMTPQAYEQYNELIQSGGIFGMVPPLDLQNAFSMLRVGDTSDYNHFWFYSFIAFICYKVFLVAGLSLKVHQSFMVLHAILFFIVLSAALRFYGWRGAITVLVLTFGSPILWYVDKVHTEFFTFTLTLTAIILIGAKRYLSSSFFLALVSTQNPSFALVAFIPFIYRIIFEKSKRYSFSEVVLFSGTCFLVLIHPIYYLIRYKVLTPQLLAGGAAPGEYFSFFYIWLLDPDVGLLPNWPLGTLLLAYSLLFCFWSERNELAKSKKYIFFMACYLLIGLYANSSSTNLNSGATTGVARYALWYVPLFFPIVNNLFNHLPKNKVIFLVGVLLLLALFIYNFRINKPVIFEQNSKPSKISFLLQKNFPNLYNPPIQIFSERFSGKGNYLNQWTVRGVVGPDCLKVLLYPGEGRAGVHAPANCHYDSLAMASLFDNLASGNEKPFYRVIPKSDADAIRISYKPGDYKVGLDQTGNWVLNSGWSWLEPWGVWSEGSPASLILPCPPSNDIFKVASVDSQAALSLHSLIDKQAIEVLNKGRVLSTVTLNPSENKVLINFTDGMCIDGFAEIEINIQDPRSPKEMGISQDLRKLGVSFTGFSLK